MGAETAGGRKQELIASISGYADQLAKHIGNPGASAGDLESINDKAQEFFRLAKAANAMDLGAVDRERLYSIVKAFHDVVAKKSRKLKGKAVEAGTASAPVKAAQQAEQRKEQTAGTLKQTENAFREMLKPEDVVRESERENTPKRISDTPHQLDKRGIFTYHEQVWKDSTGREFNRSYVDFGNAAVVLPIDANGNILLIRQHRTPANDGNGEWLLEAIAGKIDKTKTGEYEKPEENAVKEAAQEGGLKIRNMKKIASGYSTPGRASEKMYVFYADVEEEGSQSLEGHETILKQFERVTPEKAIEMIASGEIADMKTIVAIQGYVLQKRTP